MNNLRQLCIETIDTFTYKQITFTASKDLKKLNIRILKELTGSVNDTELFIDLDEQQLKKLIYFLNQIDKTILI